MSRRSKNKTALKHAPKDTSKAVNTASFKAERTMRRKAASGTKSKADSSVTFKAANPFLSVPIGERIPTSIVMPSPADTSLTEIRLKIYGYLFLDPPHAKLAPTDNTLRNRLIDLADKHRMQGGNMAFDDLGSDSLDSDVYDDSDFDYGMFDPDRFLPYDNLSQENSVAQSRIAELEERNEVRALEIASIREHEEKIGEDSSDSSEPEDEFGGFSDGMGDMCDGMFNEVYNLGGPMPFEDDMADYMDYQRHAADTQGLDSWFNDFTDDENGREGDQRTRDSNTSVFPKDSQQKRHMAILRTNRQIYDEASALLRSDLTIEVKPGDALTDNPGNAVVKQSGKTWRHDPFKGLGFTDTHDRTFYMSSALDGAVEPHVFAQFRKIHYMADFDFQLDSAAPSFLYVTDDLNINAEDAAKFVSYLSTAKSSTRWFEDPLPGHSLDSGRRETLKDVADIAISSVTITQPSTAEIVRKFVHLLCNSPFIRCLEFVINIKVNCEEDTSPDSDDETDSEKDARDALTCQIADEKATELFLESGVLNSLRDLTNVMCFSPKVATLGRGETTMKLQQKHIKILRDLKEVMENNWRIKHGPR